MRYIMLDVCTQEVTLCNYLSELQKNLNDEAGRKDTTVDILLDKNFIEVYELGHDITDKIEVQPPTVQTIRIVE